MEVLYHIRPHFGRIFPYIGLIYGRLQFRFLKWPLNKWSNSIFWWVSINFPARIPGLKRTSSAVGMICAVKMVEMGKVLQMEMVHVTKCHQISKVSYWDASQKSGKSGFHSFVTKLNTPIFYRTMIDTSTSMILGDVFQAIRTPHSHIATPKKTRDPQVKRFYPKSHDVLFRPKYTSPLVKLPCPTWPLCFPFVSPSSEVQGTFKATLKLLPVGQANLAPCFGKTDSTTWIWRWRGEVMGRSWDAGSNMAECVWYGGVLK